MTLQKSSYNTVEIHHQCTCGGSQSATGLLASATATESPRTLLLESRTAAFRVAAVIVTPPKLSGQKAITKMEQAITFVRRIPSILDVLCRGGQ